MNDNILEILDFLDPSILDYQEWVNVGMGLKESGYSCSVWDDWSRKDSKRYHAGECERKWSTFNGVINNISLGTIVQMAKNYGWSKTKDEGHELDWNDEIKDDLVVVNKAWLEDKEILEPDNWNPVEQLVKYLEILFESTENVGYVTESWEKDGKFLPNKGAYDRTAGELIQLLNSCKNDIGSVIGDYNQQAGAWIRFNPLDGKGVKNDNVTDFRYALVESDSMPIEQQNAIYREMELPIACLVHSGKKSLHAIVKIEASNYDEYRKRVDYLYNVCKKNGLKVDNQNRNPSRLSRMPGIIRNGKKQFLVDTNIGKESWNEWKEWIESINDDLPDPENLETEWNNMPELSAPLIDGLLRQGHKMLIAGPSKAGKSFALIEMCIAIAEGEKWLAWNCAKGKVLYVNLELDRASCLHRFKDVYSAIGLKPNNLSNIDIWNLRGKSIPMDKLAPKLIRRAAKKDYIAIIIDPIYKVITGDENSADQMAHFSNQFDKVCTELGCAVIYCHHHSKGNQGSKRSMDRASGSGVFARDPDALIDIIELEVNENVYKAVENKAICDLCIKSISHVENWEDEVSEDDMCSASAMKSICKNLLFPSGYKNLEKEIENAKIKVRQRTAWRVEGTLREFPKFDEINMFFEYPVHLIDDSFLKDLKTESEKAPWQRAIEKRKPKEVKENERRKALEIAYEACKIDGVVTVPKLAEYMAVTEQTVRNRIKEHGGFWIDEGNIGKKA